MKDAEFIELLNLYLDHEISAADAARLEAEVQRNPARRKIYRQYCQMQKACTLLAKDYAEAAPAADKVVAFEPRRTNWQPVWWSAAGLAAAAACAAFVLVGRNGSPSEVSSPVAAYVPPSAEPQPQPLMDATASRAIARTVTTPVRRDELQPALSSRAFTLVSAQALAADSAEAQLAWIRNVQLAPMQSAANPDELRFDARATLKQGPTIYRSRQPLQGNVEMTAFQFQK